MNKVTTVNLNGNAFQLEESGYEALRAYLDDAAAKLAGNPDKDEIMSDIEQAIADKLRAVLGAYKTVVTTQQVEAAIAEMGPVDDGTEGTESAESDAGRSGTHAERAAKDSTATAGEGTGPTKRLYRLYDGAMISGVCNGIAAHLNLDPTIIRLIFVVLAVITGGIWILAYLVLIFVIPAATTAADKSAAHGATFTAQEFIRRAKAGYYEGLKAFPDRHARREWKRRFKQDMRTWRRAFRWEMRMGALQWRENWRHYWAEHPRLDAGWYLGLPFLSLLHALLALGCIVAVIGLLTTGTVFGLGLPADIPVWVAIILAIIAYKLVVWPLKAARHSFYYHGTYSAGPGPRVFLGFWEAMVWLTFVAVLAWLALRHIPLLHEAIRNIPSVFHQAVDAIQRWWAHR